MLLKPTLGRILTGWGDEVVLFKSDCCISRHNGSLGNSFSVGSLPNGVRGWGGELWNAVSWTWQGHCMLEPTAAMTACTGSSRSIFQRGLARSSPGLYPFLRRYWLELASGGRENHSFLKVWLLVGFLCFSGWSYTHVHRPSMNWI